MNIPLRPLTSRTRTALAISRSLAAGRGESALSPLHILIGILGEGQNLAVAGLQLEGVNVQYVRAALQERLGNPTGRPAPHLVAIERTSSEESVLELADNEAALRGAEALGPEHILIAILRNDLGGSAQVLAQHGISVEIVERGVRAASAGPPA